MPLSIASQDTLLTCWFGLGARRHRLVEFGLRESVPSAATALRRLEREDAVVLPSLGDLSLAIVHNRRRWSGMFGADRAGRKTDPAALSRPATKEDLLFDPPTGPTVIEEPIVEALEEPIEAVALADVSGRSGG